MTRKDSEKDADRPHYYSQFWLDVAAGRKVIGSPKTAGEEAEATEPEIAEPTPVRKSGRTGTPTVSDGRRDTYASTEIEPLEIPEEIEEIEEPEVEEESPEEEVSEVSEVSEEEIPTIVADEEIPDMAIEQDQDQELSLEEMEEELFDEEEEEEEEPWGAGRGRKKPKPGRQTKQPKRLGKRDRRGGY